MKAGDVFRWVNFPYPQIGTEIKPRWFIYLGNSPSYLTPIIAYLCTTTTSLMDFEKGGRREGHKYYRFGKGKYPFEEECVLDFYERPFSFSKQELETNKDIEIRGSLDDGTIREIYEGIYHSSYYSRQEKIDIHDSLNLIGITGLRKI